jgi:hypothetical protein
MIKWKQALTLKASQQGGLILIVDKALKNPPKVKTSKIMKLLKLTMLN